MAKLRKTSEDIVDFIETVISERTTLEHLITWRILSNDNQKEMIKISKSSAVTEYFAKMEDSVIIYVNEEIFDSMQPQTTDTDEIDYRKLIIEDALATIQIVENDKTGTMKIVIAKPQICITSDGYAKYGENLAHAAEIASMAYTQIQEMKKQKAEEEKERKRQAKEMKRNG